MRACPPCLSIRRNRRTRSTLSRSSARCPIASGRRSWRSTGGRWTSAHDPAGWPELRRFLRLWAWRAIAVAEPGYYEARDRARAGTGGGMLLEDALRQYRPGA